MSPHQAISLDFKPVQKPTTEADFTYKITPDTIAIVDTGKGRRSVTNDIESVLRKIEYWHQGCPCRSFHDERLFRPSNLRRRS
jgi:hypothetical protein